VRAAAQHRVGNIPGATLISPRRVGVGAFLLPKEVMMGIMDPEMKRLWVEALRSGAYDQTRKALRDERGYCCLGVLATINGVMDQYDPDATMLRDEHVVEWGLIRHLASLVSRNDTRGWNFAEIATYIEEEL
jgi:hypothetical protein